MSEDQDRIERWKNLELDESEDTPVVHPQAAGFVDKVTPKEPPKDVFFFRCKCGCIHYRHAGYVKSMVPVLRAGGDKTVAVHDYQVFVCVSCRNCYIWVNEQMYDVTGQIDLEAWEKAEKELQRATGPGGEC